MEPLLKQIALAVAEACELISVGVVALGAAAALGRLVWRWREYADLPLKKDIWRRFAATIVLALEFALAADIARTAIAPSWDDIAHLAAIAAIRTGLNWFLERDLETAQRDGAATGP
jgi:uncharacterized membrane protein